ncbi:Vacuolar sorting protein VPS36 [Ceraceosorus bombacis]|uniref:Vacuolar protein-sorting-associated protein 36 n=1 Tax=Ceraceosorus bombacis TaxID=401625 RepID=A0A0P1BCP3_9BASI|nr:Vacuolar sorting protein VPS36 [Ceraceosorus bombacis]
MPIGHGAMSHRCIRQAYHPSDLPARPWTSVAVAPDELRLFSCSGAGLYLKEDKSAPHARGFVILTTHRILFVPAAELNPHDGIEVYLRDIRQTEHYAGFLSSSPKVSLLLAPPGTSTHSERTPSAVAAPLPSASTRPSSSSASRHLAASAAQNDLQYASDGDAWVCAICTFSNQASSVCQLCGVPKQKASAQENAGRASAASRPPATTSGPTDPRDSSASHSSGGDELEYRLPSRKVSPNRGGPATATATSGQEESHTATVKRRSSSNICPICTFANHPYLPTCELCGAPLSSTSSKLSLTSKGGNNDRWHGQKSTESTSGDVNGSESLKIAFREGKDKTFYSTLKGALRARAWEDTTDSRMSLLHDLSSISERRASPLSLSSPAARSSPGAHSPAAAHASSPEGARRPIGIDGILSAVDARAQADNQSLSIAFSDLEALASQARRMVDLASSLSLKLAKAKAIGDESVSEETQSLISHSMVTLGLKNPALLKTEAKDEKEFLLGLAKELAGLLFGIGSAARDTSSRASPNATGGLMGRGRVTHAPQEGATLAATSTPATDDSSESIDSNFTGMMGLDEAWVIWNRARGVALISPATFRKVVDVLPLVTSPIIRMRVLSSGLRVLHTPRWSDESFQMRIKRYLYPFTSQQHSSAQSLPQTNNDETETETETEADADAEAPDVERNVVISPWGDGLSTAQLANLESAPIAFISEMLQLAETSGALLRDENAAGGGTRWFGNYILHFQEQHQEHQQQQQGADEMGLRRGTERLRVV